MSHCGQLSGTGELLTITVQDDKRAADWASCGVSHCGQLPGTGELCHYSLTRWMGPSGLRRYFMY